MLFSKVYTILNGMVLKSIIISYVYLMNAGRYIYISAHTALKEIGKYNSYKASTFLPIGISIWPPTPVQTSDSDWFRQTNANKACVAWTNETFFFLSLKSKSTRYFTDCSYYHELPTVCRDGDVFYCSSTITISLAWCCYTSTELEW